ncbi:hypothetical protein NQZ68_014780 [Dissostichus eleginoides]|nr:hypothetical protein NQZ68_014780 [Dissostichus eleginoides]
MPNSAGKRFKPTKYIPVSTAATLLVGSTTLFFVFTAANPQVLGPRNFETRSKQSCPPFKELPSVEQRYVQLLRLLRGKLVPMGVNEAELNGSMWIRRTAVCGRKVRESAARCSLSFLFSTNPPTQPNKPGRLESLLLGNMWD